MYFRSSIATSKKFVKDTARQFGIEINRRKKAVPRQDALVVRFNARVKHWWEDPSAPPEIRGLGSVAGDKRVMRRYIGAMGLNLPQMYFDVPTLDAIDFRALPHAFVIKPDNCWSGKGVMLIVGEAELLTGAAVPRSTLPEFCQRVFASTHFESAPRILVEEFLHDYDPRFVIPRDFKVYVAGGRAWIVQVIDRNGPEERRNHIFYTRDWIKIEDHFQTGYKPGPAVVKPALLPDLLEAAELVAGDTGVFARLDFYLTTRGIVFGEFTAVPFHGAGFTPFGEQYLCELMDRFPDAMPEGWSPECRHRRS
jgi:hypothetical protein